MNRPNPRAIPLRCPPEYDLATCQPPRFPQEIRLRAATKLGVHELCNRDRERLKAFFAGCSPEAIRYRFLSPIKEPSDSLLDYLADADGLHHFALIVTQGQGDDEKIVAEGRYVIVRERPHAADIALLVLDEFQRRGIATLLIHKLMENACSQGVTQFSADVLADNRAMLGLLRKMGHTLSGALSQGVIHFEFPIACREETVSEAA